VEKNGYPSHWWAALCAVPTAKESVAYRRLQRVWFDHTRFHGPRTNNTLKSSSAEKALTPRRYHEFVRPNDETNLTVTLWENFVIFDVNKWLPAVFESAGLPPITTSIDKCNWGYEWWSHAKEKRMCDIVLGFEAGETRSIVVVEAKRLDTRMTPDDLNPAYYLDTIPEIADFGDCRYLIYLLDQTRSSELAQAIHPRQP
jgi:hypothetical protein